MANDVLRHLCGDAPWRRRSEAAMRAQAPQEVRSGRHAVRCLCSVTEIYIRHVQRLFAPRGGGPGRGGGLLRVQGGQRPPVGPSHRG